jgi:sarcosine oxidase subunit delta
MRINCPLCGERGVEEFTYHGDATVTRPLAAAPPEAWVEYVYLRDNPAGPHDELWYHTAGCHAWLVVRRDLRSHAVMSARLARDVATARPAAA